MSSTPTKSSWFSRRVFAIPFGHYEAGDDQEPPANEILIGREGQRAFFIDLLMNMGRRGAYLVTGRRGAGKTSFVRHCIAEYKAEVYGRYVRSSVGRALFWDRLIVLFLFTAVILGALLLSELLDILTRAISAADSGPRRLLLWLFVTPIALFCVYPLLYAKELLEVFVGALHKEQNWEDRQWRLVAVFVVLVFAAFAWFTGPFGSPALGISRLFVAMSGIAVLVQIISYRRSAKDEISERPGFVRRNWIHLIPLTSALLYIYFGGDGLGIPTPEKEYWANLGLGLLLIAASIGLRGLYQWRVATYQEEIGKVKKAGAKWYALSAVLVGGAGTLFLVLSLANTPALIVALILAVLLACGVVRVLRLKHGQAVFQPRPLYAIAGKAVVSAVVGLQLVHPVLSRLDPMDLGMERNRLSVYLRHEVSLHQVRGADGLFHGKEAHPSPAGTELQRQPRGVRQELNWIFAVLLVALLLYFLEYEWIVRPFLRQRIDRAFADRPGPWDDQEGHKEEVDRRKTQRMMASTTFPWMIYKEWLPVLVLSVNLGFDRLDHRRVVHAMLAALRDEYHRTFLSWSSALANLGRLVALLLIMAMVTLVGEQLFMPDTFEPVPQSAITKESDANYQKELAKFTKESDANYQNICDVFRGRQAGASAVNLICALPYGDKLFHLLYFDLITSRWGEAFQYPPNHLLFWFLPYQEIDFPDPDLNLQVLLKRGLSFRVYHLLLFILFFLGSKWALHRLPILPYHETVKRLDSMLDSLSSRTSTSSKQIRWKPAQWLQGYFQDENLRQVQQDPIDPRTLEFAFLTILQDIQHAPLQLPGAKNQLISLPTPEITFIFDELDKLGTRMGPREAVGGEKQEAEILDDARRRSIQLHRLLANMKNLLSSAPARFIFVGGRNLHDEWLADQTARHPLLTNIFSAEVYLPSLLTDHPWERDDQPRLHEQVEAYLLQQAWRARVLYCRWAKARWLPSFGLPVRQAAPESFVTRGAKRDVHPTKKMSLPSPLEALGDLKVLLCEASDSPGEAASDLGQSASEAEGGLALLQDFVYFMTYRSMGNPKRLKELLALFVRPISRAVRNPKIRWSASYDCRHVLAFGDVERFRVQLLADIYRHLTLAFERRLVVRDDKLAISVFFLTDYLFKFHRRAFSWSNLERVDELVDIHRAPDLREILEEILEHWSERFLHPIRNGMYAFRFRSDIAREIEYLSRQSPHEMAAFNFTLDESVALKSLYASNIQRLEPTAKQELQDLLAGMGELHEFDQEYEAARQHYRRSIHMLDTEFEQVIGKAGESKSSPILSALSGSDKGAGNVRLYITWGAARLRLMLQIGLTFEFARNLERAAVEYRNARTLARSLTLAMLGESGLWDSVETDFDLPKDRRLHVLKNLNILFQPVFAEAWVAEKLGGGVDTSVSLVEKEIWRLRLLLPFVQDFKLQPSANAVEVRGSNFALIAAELHNKAGDLYFFKGRQLVSREDLKGFRELVNSEYPRHGSEGYLLRAHYHYAMGLHELRRFVTHRRWSSRFKFNIWQKEAFGKENLWEPIAAAGLPDFVFRSVGGTLNDLAETMLGRVSLYGLFHDLEHKALAEKESNASTAVAPKFLKSEMVMKFARWLTFADQPEDYSIKVPLEGGDLPAGSLDGWLGSWKDDSNSEPHQILAFGESQGHDDRGRLIVSLHFTLVGAKYLERGGYLEDAASELFEVCEMVTHYMWWGLTVKRLGDWYTDRQQKDVRLGEPSQSSPLEICIEVFNNETLKHGYWKYLYDLAVYSLRKADQLFQRSRRAEEVRSTESHSYLLGAELPPSVLTLACSLGLVARGVFTEGFDQTSLMGLIGGWIGKKDPIQKPLPALSVILEQSLTRHSYPMINRLQGLKALIDSEILAEDGHPSEEMVDRILARTQELLSMEELFDAPMHFTPLQAGLTCSLVDLFFRSRVKAGWKRPSDRMADTDLCEMFGQPSTDAREPQVPHGEPAHQEWKRQWASRQNRAQRLERIRWAAQHHLNTSEEMYTMRRAYYEAISGFYYLFDDFNDRPIHFNMAMQMAGTELVSLVRGLLHIPEAEAFRPSMHLRVLFLCTHNSARSQMAEGIFRSLGQD